MKRSFILLMVLIVTLALTACSGGGSGEEEIENGILNISQVTDQTGQVIDNAEIIIYDAEDKIVGRGRGKYDLSPDSYRVEVSAKGYDDFNKEYILQKNDTLNVTPRLSKKEVPLEIKKLYLEPNSAQVEVGADFNLPQKAVAIMSDGSSKRVAVEWNGAVDTSKSGEYNFIGSVAKTTKQVEFKLVVKELEIKELRLNFSYAEVEVGDDFILPEEALAIMSNGSTKYVTPQWDKSVDTSQPGEYNFVGSVTGTEQNLEFTLVVKELTITELKLATEQITVKVGTDFTLPKTAVATMNDGSKKDLSLEWDKSVDTSQPGEYNFVGSTAKTEKTVEFTLIVEEKELTIEELSLKTQSAEVELGEDFKLPQIAVAKISDGSSRNLLVQWDKSVDTSEPGEYEFIGSVEGTEKTVTFTLVVKELEIIDLVLTSEQDEVEVGTDYILPQSALAIMSDESTKDLGVEWDKSVDTTQPGEYEFVGSVEGTEKTVIFTLVVKELTIIDLVLEPNSAEVEKGRDYTLPQEASAIMSNGSTKDLMLQWDKDVDTSEVGEYKFIGSPAGTEKRVEFTLHVVDKIGGIEIEIDLERPPTVPKNLSGEFSNGQVVLNWAKVDQDIEENDHFGGYLIYRSKSVDKEGRVINTELTPKTSYTDTDIKTGETYYYRVRAYGGQTGILAGELSAASEVSTD